STAGDAVSVASGASPASVNATSAVSPLDKASLPCCASWVKPMAEPKSEDVEQDAASPQATTTPRMRVIACLLLFPWPAITGSSKNNNLSPRKLRAGEGRAAAKMQKLQVTEPNQLVIGNHTVIILQLVEV